MLATTLCQNCRMSGLTDCALPGTCWGEPPPRHPAYQPAADVLRTTARAWCTSDNIALEQGPRNPS